MKIKAKKVQTQEFTITLSRRELAELFMAVDVATDNMERLEDNHEAHLIPYNRDRSMKLYGKLYVAWDEAH